MVKVPSETRTVSGSTVVHSIKFFPQTVAQTAPPAPGSSSLSILSPPTPAPGTLRHAQFDLCVTLISITIPHFL